MLKREEGSTRDESTDEFIRINRQTYSPVEVQKDIYVRTIYTPIQTNASPNISLVAQTRSPSGSDNEDMKSKPIEDELIEVEYPLARGVLQDAKVFDVKIKVGVEIIHPKVIDRRFNTSSYKFYKSCLTKKELVKLITDEIKLEETEMINLVEILNQASMSRIEQTEDCARLQCSSELLCGESIKNEPTAEEKYNKKVDEVRAELRK